MLWLVNRALFPMLCWPARTGKGLGKATVTVITPRWHLILLPKIKQRKGRTAGDTIQADKKSISPLTPDLQQPWNNHLKKKKSQMTYTHPLQADIRLERQDGKDYFSFHILSYFVSVDMIWFADKLFFNISLFCNSPAHVYNSISADFQLIIQLINESFIVPLKWSLRHLKAWF